MRTTSEILAAIITGLTALRWTPDGGPEEALLQEVRRYDANDLQRAFSELLVIQQRVALVIYTGERWNTLPHHDEIGPVAQRTLQISILLSDAVIGDRQSAVFGSPSTPGCIPMHELAIRHLAGPLFPSGERVWLAPTTVTLADIERDDRPAAGRTASILECDCAEETLALLSPI